MSIIPIDTHATLIHTNTNTNTNTIRVDAIVFEEVPLLRRMFGVFCLLSSLTFFALIISVGTSYSTNPIRSNLLLLVSSIAIWIVSSLLTIHYYHALYMSIIAMENSVVIVNLASLADNTANILSSSMRSHGENLFYDIFSFFLQVIS